VKAEPVNKPARHYASPRWSGELLDCSMPLTFDTYDRCSYNCLYCFSYFQKSHSLKGGCNYVHNGKGSESISHVNVKNVKRLFNLDPSLPKSYRQFFNYIRSSTTFQWGGLADQFDNNEREHGITRLLLHEFKKLKYPICFSTKATWWLSDDRYTKIFEGTDNWNCKFSIINLDKSRSAKMELGCPSPEARLKAIGRYSKLCKGGATLRLRPFIIGFSDKDNEHLELIKLAKEYGATAVSTEFFCLEARANANLKARYYKMSEIVGFDIFEFYRRNSKGSGYRRLTRVAKKKYIDEMDALCSKLGLRFYVSDAHFKERSCNGSCCGLSDDWNYYRGQFTEALVIAKERGSVRYSDISGSVRHVFQGVPFVNAEGFNTNSSIVRAMRYKQTMADYVRSIWNKPNSLKSPYKYFGGVLKPSGTDDNNDIIYVYDDKWDMKR